MPELVKEYADKANMLLSFVLQHVEPGHPLVEAARETLVERLIRDITASPEAYRLRNLGPVHAAVPATPSPYPQDVAAALADIDLPAIPKVVASLNAALASPDASAGQIAQIIELDPALCAAVLKLVNSPLYSLTAKVDTVTRAVAVLGVKQVYGLTVSKAVSRTISRMVPDNVDLFLFWEHGIACAIMAKHLGELYGARTPETLFVAGMLHDIGKLLQYILFPDHIQYIFQEIEDKRTSTVQAEEDILGFDHTVLGAMLLEQWGFPDSLVAPVRHHHSPLDAPDLRPACAVHVADLLAHVLTVQPGALAQAPPATRKEWEPLGIEARQMVEFLDGFDDCVQDVMAVMHG